MSLPSVTVVIATYRPGGAVLPLRGLMRQTYQNFDTVVVSECGVEAIHSGAVKLDRAVLHKLEPLNFHAPTRALNLGIRLASGDIVAMLADFAWPHEHWLRYLAEELEQCNYAVVGGPKCSHGVAANPGSIEPPLVCDRQLIPVGLKPGRHVIYPCQHGYTLGNIAAWRKDVNAINGLEERFAGDHGYEDENFVRRMVASQKRPAVMMSEAFVHHYWPYHVGFKPLLAHSHRTWAHGHANAELDRMLIDSELCVGNYEAKRVELTNAPSYALRGRKPSRPPAAE